MPPDPLEHPIAALTDHPILTAEDEAALLSTMIAGAQAKAAILQSHTPASPELVRQIAIGEEARAALVRHNMRLVVSIAKRYLGVAGQHLSLEDLVSFGSIGLLQSIDKFDPGKGKRLSTYATWWIRQAIGRGIAEESRVIDLPVHIHERLSKYRKARSRLSQQLAREPQSEEIAVELGWRPQQVAQLEAMGQDTMSLNAKVRDTNDRTELGDIVPDQRFDPEEAAVEASVCRDIADAMQRLLTERERRFLRAYFGFDNGQKATLEEVGAAEGLTRERVRQVIVTAVAKLRDDPVVTAYAEGGSEG